MNDFFSSFYPLEKLQFGSDDTVLFTFIVKKRQVSKLNSGHSEIEECVCVRNMNRNS